MDKDKTSATGPGGAPRGPRHGLLAFSLAGIVFGMVGLSFAAVPLYELFCQVTGYGGTTQRAETAPAAALDRQVTVRFDANTSRDMAWQFRPVQRSVQVKIGEQSLAFYRAHNPASVPVKGMATFNVSPDSAGSYFNKMQCFCFVEQVLQPGESMDMPVSFFVDPAILDDPEAKEIRQITLSYTFFPMKEEPPVSEAGADEHSS